MTQIEKLDTILSELAFAKANSDTIEQPGSGFGFNGICKELELQLKKGEEKILKEILLSDGNIDYSDKGKLLVKITSNGINFIAKGGYQKLEEDERKKQEKEEFEIKLNKSNLTTNRWTKYGIAASIFISLIALVISIIALLQKNN